MSIEAIRTTVQRRMSNLVENTVNSFRVAPQWQIPAVAFGSLGVLEAHQTVKNLKSGRILEAIPTATVSVSSTLVAGFCELMASGYFQDYKKMKGLLDSRGWDRRIVDQELGFYCGKRAATVAAIDSGYKEEFDNHLRISGRKPWTWYKLIQDI